ncbi:hypothetical protein [Mitsuaria sp. GD03876]|uniref:hypothetical protein n=1 Tax=Mitsuaria sp. GD03876 TaxID=2975399 RepID=UPI00244C9953|nr:hypothetical protein [Mitsuaria sp. GD03876]MDH0863950.1 hypothetical protein [Mitsuaria sp. GD03876]
MPASAPARATALILSIAPILLALSVGARAASTPLPPPKPAKAPAPTGIAPRGTFITPEAASARPGMAAPEEGSDEAFRADAESRVLRRAGIAARRDGLRLMLPVAQGRPVVLDSLRPDPADASIPYVDYRLDGLSPDRAFYVVRVSLSAGDELLWISREDGTRYEMHGNAHPSPDGRHLVVTHASPGAEFNGVVVWSLADGKLVERYKFQPAPDQAPISFRFMRWRDADTVELEQFAEVDPSNCAIGTLASLAQLTRKGDRWILRSASAPRCER